MEEEGEVVCAAVVLFRGRAVGVGANGHGQLLVGRGKGVCLEVRV